MKGFLGLIDSGSSDCLMDSSFVDTYKLPFRVIEPLPLTLIDGTVSQYVMQTVMLPIRLACGYSCSTEFYVTYLDGSSPVVLGLNWLKDHNPSIDWKEGTLFLPPPQSQRT